LAVAWSFLGRLLGGAIAPPNRKILNEKLMLEILSKIFCPKMRNILRWEEGIK